MIVNQENLETLRTGLRTDFNGALTTAAPVSGPMVTPITSGTRVETYGFLGDLPIFRKWVGDKRIKSVAEKSYQLINEPFEATIGIHKHKIEDDNLGLYPALVKGWGQDAGSLSDRLVFEALAQGHLRPCFDGQNFFDDEHPVEYDEDGASNMSGAGAVQPWFLLDLSKPLKPFIYQTRQAPKFDMVTDMSDSHVFSTGEYLIGAEARGAAGYTLWQLAHRSTATLDAAGYEAAYSAMTELKDDNGEPLGVKPTHLVYGTSNRAAAKTLFEAQNKAGGESNIHYKDVALIEAPRLP